MDRRRFITATGLAGLTGLAGCENLSTTAIGSVAPPQVPKDQLDEGGWELIEETQRKILEEDVGPVTVTAKATSVIYDKTELAARVKEDTLGSVDGKLATFTASRIEFSPNLAELPEAVGREQFVDRVEASAKDTFVSRMETNGLSKVTETESNTLAVDSGAEARYTKYSAAFEVESFSFPLPNDENMTVDVGALTVAGDLAVWVQDGAVLVAAGAYPAENFATTLDKEISDAIQVTVDVDLALQPEQYASEMESLITATT